MGEPPYVGGIENVIDTLVNSDLAELYNISIFDTFRTPDPDRKIYQKFFYAISLFFICGYHIVTKRPHIVHIHFCSRIDFWKHSICLFVSKIFGRKTVFHLHGGSFDTFYQSCSQFTRSAVRFFFGLSDIVVALSSYWHRFLSDLVSERKIRVLPNPINCEKLSSFSTEFGNNKEHSVLLLGSLGKRKGHYDILKAMTEVVKYYPDAQVYFAGIDEDFGATENLQRIAKQYKIIKNVHFLGPVSGEAKLKLLGRATIVILPSYGENMPISVLEGMAAGKPVISSRVGAIPELFENGTCGMLIAPGDWKALAKNILYLFDNPNYAKSLGELAHQKTLANWDVSKIILNVDSIYQQLLRN